MTVTFTPYRGKFEPVTKIHKAEVKLFPENIEVIFSYDYEKYDSEQCTRYEDSCYSAHFIPRHSVSLVRSALFHTEDPDKEQCPFVGLDVPGVADTIYLRCKSNKEADNVYSTLKEYLLMI